MAANGYSESVDPRIWVIDLPVSSTSKTWSTSERDNPAYVQAGDEGTSMGLRLRVLERHGGRIDSLVLNPTNNNQLISSSEPVFRRDTAIQRQECEIIIWDIDRDAVE
jgi:WD40 repeat protein